MIVARLDTRRKANVQSLSPSPSARSKALEPRRAISSGGHGWFSDGFDTPDLNSEKARLSQVNA